MSRPLVAIKSEADLPPPLNDNERSSSQIEPKVLIPRDLPITQVEIEVFAALLDDWSVVATNDNEEP